MYLRILFIPILAIVVIACGQFSFAQTADKRSESGSDFDKAVQLHVQRKELFSQGKYKRAAEVGEEMQKILEKAVGKEHAHYADSLYNLAMAYEQMGEIRRAESTYLETKRIYERVLGEEHLKNANVLDSLAVLHGNKNDYVRAEQLSREAMEIYGKALGREHPRYAQSLTNLARLNTILGDFVRAESLFLVSKTLHEKLFGKEHPHYATTIEFQARMYRQMEDARAEPLFLEAIKIREKTLGKEHSFYAHNLNNLAVLYMVMGDYHRAEPLYLEAKRIYQRVGDKVGHAAGLNNLAFLYMAMGEWERAEPLYLETKKILGQALGKDHADYANTVNNLAILYASTGNYDRAEQLHLEATDVRVQLLGKDHPDYASSRYNLAELYRAMGEHERTESLYLEASKIYERALGKEHPLYSKNLSSLALLQFFRKDFRSAISNFEQERRSVHAYVSRLLPTLPGTRQAAYLKERYRASFVGALSAGVNRGDNPDWSNRSAEWLINGKAVGQEALASSNLDSRDLSDPNLRAIVEKRKAVRQRLAKLALSLPQVKQIEQRRAGMERLKEQEMELSRKLVALTGQQEARAEWTELGAVQQAIPDGAVLIEFARYNNFDYTKSRDKWRPPRYAAWIIPSKGDVQVVDLGFANEVDLAINEVIAEISDPIALSKKLQSLGEDETLQQLNNELTKVSDLVWQPISQELPTGTKQLIISPDSSLWLLPWTALPTEDGRFLVEDYLIRLEVSGRYLVKDFSTRKKVNRPFIFADPDYDVSTDATLEAIKAMFPQKEPREFTRGTTSRSALSRVGRLPNTKLEAAAVAPNMSRVAGQESRTYSGKWAMETVLKEVKNPKILMLATHGFFLPDQEVGKSQLTADDAAFSGTRSAALLSVDGKLIENPLLRCGLLFAGCNTGPAAGGDDGIFTGMEVVSLDLRGTEMVVLSACETGIGDVDNGEGVAGLRQAFQMAGAQSVVATLWSVPDRDSAIIMSDFFKNLAAGQSRSEALREAQLNRIKARRARHGAAHPFFWAAFTFTGKDTGG